MKTAYLLITMMTSAPIVYADKSTCTEAADALHAVDEQAVCIPRGNYEEPITLDRFFDFVIRLQDLPPQNPDVQEE